MRRLQPCAVPTCPALTRGEYCVVHQQLAHAQLRAVIGRTLGGGAPLQPVTDRIEYDAEGMPVRFYPRTRRR